MNADLWSRFGARFLASARARLERAQAAIDAQSAANVRTEMHALAGEAALLGVRSLAEIARSVEVEATRWGASASESEAGARRGDCASALARLRAETASFDGKGPGA